MGLMTNFPSLPLAATADSEILGWTQWVVTGIAVVELLFRLGTAVRIICRRWPTGATLSWLAPVLVSPIPFLATVAYWVIGESRLGHKRARREQEILEPYRRFREELCSREHIDFSTLSPASESLHREAESLVGVPGLPGNRLQLISDSEAALRSIIVDIDRAKKSCDLLFYIWHPGGTADEVGEALIRASGRGVTCRVLLDSLGSAKFLKSPLCRRMQQARVTVVKALPVGLFRSLFVRFDLRNHRKIVVVDHEVAHTGSMNLVDPRFFKRGAGVGQWIDAMVRVEGPAVELLAAAFLVDWEMETGEGLSSGPYELPQHENVGTTPVQLAVSGPGMTAGIIYKLLISAVYRARRELFITTPYFVPDDALRMALKSAARRDIDVRITVPRRVDSLLVRWASRSHFDDLIAAGVKILQFDAGLLHTKAVTIDGETGFLGTVNLDQRSFWLNFELTLLIYDSAFVSELRALQLSYNSNATAVDLARWRQRPFVREFVESAAMLAAPVL